MLPLTRSRNRARFFGIPFSPSSLFAAGEQGAWYDPSDYSTLFDDAAGVTPVSAPGNGADVWVGLMLDKSRGLVLGNELSNAATQTLATATGTQSGAGWNVTATGAFAILSQPTVLTSARWYKIRFKWSGNTNARTIRFYVGGSGGTNSIYTAGTATSGDVTFYASTGTQNTNAYFQINDSVNGDTFYLEITSVRELPGNHAFQTQSTKRPQLRARYNLLTYSEEFDNGAWGKTNITAVNTTATTDPLGGTTAEKIASTTGTWPTYIIQTVTPGVQVFSVYAKQAECRYLLMAGITLGEFSCYFDLQNGTSTGTAGFTRTMTAVGNGWYRCTVSGTFTSINIGFQPNLSGSGLTPGATGDGVYLWGADLRPASQATGLIGPTYQRVAAATVYDTAGFLPYLAFDGLDDSMSTNSINPGAVDKAQVFAGARKLSDALGGTVAEFYDGVGSNGRWVLFAPSSAASNYQFSSVGTNGSSAIATTYSAPITNVLNGYAEIGQDVCVLRVNGIQAATSSTDQGAGNYLTYPLFIGARQTGTLFFNGNLSSLIVRFGPNLSTSQIEATEAWVAGKTGVSI